MHSSQRAEDAAIPATEGLKVPLFVNLWGIVSCLVTLGMALWIHLGSLVAGGVLAIGFTALFAWRLTTYLQPAKASIIAPYILAIVALLAFGAEQWYFHLPQVLVAMFPGVFSAPVVFNDKIFLSIFPFSGTALFLYAGVSLYLKRPIGNYMAWFVFLWSSLGVLGFCLLPFFSSGGFRYLPGMYSALLPIALGVYGITTLRKDSHQASEGELS